ncbi:MAG: hypothetical protein RL077_4044, partial [Verrucomicrobiota bacterium]
MGFKAWMVIVLFFGTPSFLSFS